MQKYHFPWGAPENLTLCPNSSFHHGDKVWKLPSLDSATLCWEARLREWSDFQILAGCPSLFIQSLIINHCVHSKLASMPPPCSVIPFHCLLPLKCISVKIKPWWSRGEKHLISQPYETSAWRMWWRVKLFQWQKKFFIFVYYFVFVVVSKNWLALGGAVSPQSERVFKMSKDHNI